MRTLPLLAAAAALVFSVPCRAAEPPETTVDCSGPAESIGTDIETQCAALESFEEPVSGTQPPLPPILTVSGPVPHTENSGPRRCLPQPRFRRAESSA